MSNHHNKKKCKELLKKRAKADEAKRRSQRNTSKNINQAKDRYNRLQFTEYEAIHFMKVNYGLNPKSDLSVDKDFDIYSIPLSKRREERTCGLIFDDERVLSLTSPKKIVNHVKILSYTNPKFVENGNATVKICYYATSVIDGKPYIFLVNDFSKYSMETYLKYDKDWLSILKSKEEPIDFSLTSDLLINGKIKFDYYRLDEAAINGHSNRMDRSKKSVLDKYYVIQGTHEHEYSKVFATIFYDDQFTSYDARPLSSISKNSKGNSTFSLWTKEQALKRFQEKVNIDLTQQSNPHGNLVETYTTADLKEIEFNDITYLNRNGREIKI